MLTLQSNSSIHLHQTILINEMENCDHVKSEFENRMVCQGCGSKRCRKCEAKCEKQGCEGTYCGKCLVEGYGNKFCHKCNTQCWVCGSIPYPPYPMEKRHVKGLNVIICARHSSRPNEMKVFEDFLREQDHSFESAEESTIKKNLRGLDRQFN